MPLTLESTGFTVPEGYVGVLRSFRFEVEPQVVDSDILNTGGLSGQYEDITTTLLVDGIPVPEYEGLTLGQATREFIPCYVLANENQVFSIRFFTTDAFNDLYNDAGVERYFINVQFHGNLLLRTGVPIEYEPGNPAAAEPIVRGTEIQAGGGVARQPRALEPGQAMSRMGRRTGQLHRTTVRRARPTRRVRATPGAVGRAFVRRRTRGRY